MMLYYNIGGVGVVEQGHPSTCWKDHGEKKLSLCQGC